MSADDAAPLPVLPDCDVPRYSPPPCVCGPDGDCFPECPKRQAREAGVDPIVEAVRADLLARSTLGIGKYGCTLDALTMRAALQHAYEEALDLANYLKRALASLP